MNARSLLLLCLPMSALLFVACGEDEAPSKPSTGRGGKAGASTDAGAGGDEGGGDTSGKGGTGGSGGSGTLTCKKHSACEAGEKLVRACSLCIQQVCDITPTCCGEEWDENCVASAKRVPVCDCGDTPSGGAGGSAGKAGGAGSGPVTCHDTCTEGGRLEASCGVCAANVCAIDAFCCEEEWDAQCVFKASNVAEGCDCEPIDTCHSPCEAGDALTIECDPCVADVCAAFPNCCDPDNGGWGAQYCVTAAKEACSVCQTPTGGAGGKAGAGGAATSKKCPENPCIAGGKAVAGDSCNACIEAVITAKPTCADGWKQGCADLAKADPQCACPAAGGAGGSGGASGTGGTAGKAGAAGTGGAAGKAGAGGSAGKAGSAGSSTGGSGGAATTSCPVGACHPKSPLQSVEAGKCSNCATEICAAHPECCATEWTATCAGYALNQFKGICGCPDLSKCSHDTCEWGQQLDPTCSPCVKRICELDDFCCKDSGIEIEWDGACIAKWDKAIKDGDPACVVQDQCKP